ncbi:MAG TPA: iron-containing redox enzyme family protein [Nitrososphaerales archaeon]|nr:iron-containing redox enzyme family protein [Nitrososphaerales archaeon]
MRSETTSPVEKIDEIVQRMSLLKHPFYQKWSCGELTAAQLSGYAKEYFQLVKAVPGLVGNVGAALGRREDENENASLGSAILGNFQEEQEHIELWRRFASSLGIGREELDSYAASQKTVEAVSQLESLSKLSFEEAIASMYAYESALPEISRSKTKGLKEFYGLDSNEATIYFNTHEKVDVLHAALWRGILEKLPSDKQEAAILAATKSMEAQNLLLDSVMDRYVNNPA